MITFHFQDALLRDYRHILGIKNLVDFNPLFFKELTKNIEIN